MRSRVRYGITQRLRTVLVREMSIKFFGYFADISASCTSNWAFQIFSLPPAAPSCFTRLRFDCTSWPALRHLVVFLTLLFEVSTSFCLFLLLSRDTGSFETNAPVHSRERSQFKLFGFLTRARIYRAEPLAEGAGRLKGELLAADERCSISFWILYSVPEYALDGSPKIECLFPHSTLSWR